MTYYYPQWAMTLRIRLEELSFQQAFDARLKQEYVITVVPKSLTVNINDYTKADTFTCELDYKTFPFDPRIIRGIGVTIHAQDMQRMQDANGLPNIITPSGSNNSVEGPPAPNVPPDNGNIIFLGFADTETIKLSEDQRTITFEGRDLTSLFLDTPYNDPNPLSLNISTNDLIKQLIKKRPETANIIVRSDVTIPALSKVAPDFNALSGKLNVRSDHSYWDVIQELAGLSGVVIYMDLDTLVITQPQVLYSKDNLKQLIWGKNVNTLEFKRKMGRLRGFNIIVRCLTTGNKKSPVLQAQIPKEGSLEWSKKTGIARKEVVITQQAHGKEPVEKPADYISFRVENVANKESLVKIGEQLYENLGRQQIEGSLETYDMVLPENATEGTVEFDALKLRTGTAIDIHIDQDDLKAISREASQGARFAYLQARGYKEDLANLLAENLSAFTTPFYTKAVTFNFSQESGFKMTLDFINFIELSQSLVR